MQSTNLFIYSSDVVDWKGGGWHLELSRDKPNTSP